MIGIVVKNISDLYFVKCNEKVYQCKAKGIFRKDNFVIKVGDSVEIDLKENIITKVNKRKNELIRPSIVNVDQALVVVSAIDPIFSDLILDKMLCIIEFNNIKPIICITKMDLLDDKINIEKYIDYYKKIGYEVYMNFEIDKIIDVLKNKITVITGQSGVGKSSLLNSINKDFNLKVGEISYGLKRGKNTTRHVELLNISGGLVADTPGFSAIDFLDMTNQDIRDNFIEFNNYKDKCKYKDCMHLKEDDCYIKEQVASSNILSSRYENYRKFVENR